MEINRETVKHSADLSEISLTEPESESLERDLAGIVEYISQISELDTADIEPTYQVFEMENVWRDDVVLEQDATREQLLALSKEQQNNQVKVPKVL